MPQTNPINVQQIDRQGQSVYHDNSPQGHYQDQYQHISLGPMQADFFSKDTEGKKYEACLIPT